MSSLSFYDTTPDLDVERALSRALGNLFGRAVPVRVGRFELLSRVGEGGAGEVWAAHDPVLQRKVALKLLRARSWEVAPSVSSLGSDPTFRTRIAELRREARALAALSDPRIVTAYEVGTHEERVYLAMEYVEGQTLHEWLKHERSWGDVVHVLCELGEALVAMHAVRLVHRDIKPSNVMLVADRNARTSARPTGIKILDFGLATTLTEDTEYSREACGTFFYMAPEQLEGKLSSPASDQFAFCVLAWEALAGQRPFVARDVASRIGEIALGPPLEQWPRQLPQTLARAFARGLRSCPRERWSSMQALVTALRESAQCRKLRNALVPVVMAASIAALRTHEPSCEQQVDEKVQTLVEIAPAGAELLPELERYAATWGEVYRGACQQHGALDFDATVLCLDDALATITVLRRRVEDGSLPTSQAVLALARMSSPSLCAVTGVRGIDKPGAHELARYEDALHRYNVLVSLGSARASPELESLAAAVATLDAPALRADVELVVGVAALHDQRLPDAARHYENGYHTARRIGHELSALRAAVLLMQLHGYDLGDMETSLHWRRQAEAAFARMETIPDTGAASFHNALAHVLAAQGQLEQATEHQLRAVERAGSSYDGANMRLALSVFYARLGRHDEARLHADAAFESLRERLGEGHPMMIQNLDNYGAVLAMSGDFGAAKPVFERAHELALRLRGPEHPDTAATMHNLGMIALDSGTPEQGAGWLARALAVRRDHFPVGHPLREETYLSLAVAQRRAGNAADARATYTTLVNELERAASQRPRAVVGALLQLAQLDQATGDFRGLKGVIQRMEPWLGRPEIRVEQRELAAELVGELNEQ